MWAFAEFTTVILAGAFPTMPRLTQWLREHNDSVPYKQSHQNPSKPSYVTTTGALADAEAAYLGKRTNLAGPTRESYISLEEDVGLVRSESESEMQQEQLRKGSSGPSTKEGRERR